jgi:UDP-N-acetylmuramate--alanine ligase
VLKKLNIKWELFSKDNIKNQDLIIHSAGCDDTNEELARAKELGLPIMTFPQMVGEIIKDKKAVTVSGCNGKTTTTAMISYILTNAGVDPYFIVGTPVDNLDLFPKCKSDIFVVEADEYRQAFFNYAPYASHAIITNIEWDHPDCYPTFEDMIKSYSQFIKKLPSGATLYGYADDNDIDKTIDLSGRKDLQILRYGMNGNCDIQIKNVKHLKGKNEFEIFQDGKSRGEYELIIPGDHNILNATAAVSVCLDLGVDSGKIREILKTFKGLNRRFEIHGVVNGITVVDDYAHHPTAIDVTLAAAKQFYPDSKIWCVFQPHTFSRTKALFEDFSKAFGNADEVIIPEIYPSAREKDTGEISSRDLVDLTRKYHDHVRYVKAPSDSLEILQKEAKSGDVIMVMGAGEMWKTVAKAFVDQNS